GQASVNTVSIGVGGAGTQVTLTLDNNLLVNGGSSNALSGATVKLTGGYAGDLLSVNTGGTNVVAGWGAPTQTLTLSGTDTAANYRTLLDAVIFSSTATDPTNGGANRTRTATWQVTDATNSQLSATQSETIDLSLAYAPIGIAVSGTTSKVLQGGS